VDRWPAVEAAKVEAAKVDVVSQRRYDMGKSLQGRYAMAKTAMIRARTDEKLKEQVEGIFHKLGMTTTEAINLFYRQVKVHRGLPFLVRIPNAETRRTLEKSARGEDVIASKDAEDLFKKLGMRY
jgi:DNA-damage-inducible protein J